jgi:hydrogenase maturation protein HypF
MVLSEGLDAADPAITVSGASVEGRRVRIRGTVQGVGFRPWVYRLAQKAGVTGRVHNDTAGVAIDVFGAPETLARFLTSLGSAPPPAARILEVTVSDLPAEAATSFVIVESDLGAERRVSIPPDLTMCDTCAAEIADPADRRYRYPFTNCTNCGPRFTIAADIPYDRSTTTMARFTMCEACQDEYDAVDDRRFHAQPNACPACGPRLMLHDSTGTRLVAGEPIGVAAQAIRDGLVVALKGLGGFHLVCDATSAAAVQRLRDRKHRDEKPLAVMVADLAAAAAIGVVGPEEQRLLTSVERPIVIMPKRDAIPLADNVAPRNRMIGLFLPYTPLHQLLLADAGRPLVMTSGNLSEEPIAFRNDEAVRRLGAIADRLLMHDRDIQTRCDDSVVSVIAGRPIVLRRSRGYVPRAIRLARLVVRPVLACGALLKNTFCFAAGDSAWFGPHVGDLECLETYESYTEGIARLEQFLQLRPDVIAYDLHPDYLSSRYARERPEAIKVAVQHHHAHVVSAMAEHELEGPVIGIAYDGSGYGTDGTMWGGELLVARLASFDRLATFRPVPLVGGDRAIREPWRIAVALLDDAFSGRPPAAAWSLLGNVPAADLVVVRRLLDARVNAPLARGVGRYFDGFGALFLGRTRASFEGQVALEWNQAADPIVTHAYGFEIATGDVPWLLDLRPAVRQAVHDALEGTPPAAIAAAFHNTLVEATSALVARIVRVRGRLPVVATGGCFQNARLAEGVRAALSPEHDVRLHEAVPPGDGGLALGQALVADARVGGR